MTPLLKGARCLAHVWYRHVCVCVCVCLPKGPITTLSYGVDPVFKLGTDLYNPNLDDLGGKLVRHTHTHTHIHTHE